MKITAEMVAAADAFLRINHSPAIDVPHYHARSAFYAGWEAALAVQTQQGVEGLTKTQIETLANNIHNVNEYAYTVECLTHHCAPRSALVDVPAVESEPEGGGRHPSDAGAQGVK